MQAQGTLSHLLTALGRSIGRVAKWFFLTLVITALIVEVVAFFAVGADITRYHPTALTHIAAVVLGLAVGYSVGLTILVGEVIHFLMSTIEALEQDVKKEVVGDAKTVEGIIQSIEHREHHS